MWRVPTTWPPPGLGERVARAPAGGVDELDVVGDVGLAAWISCAGALPWGQPLDQRADDARSMTYDWPIDATAEVAGNASVALRVRASAPVAHLAVKLCDVFPDGTSALITRGMLNLTHRGCWPADADGEAGRSPAPVVPGEWMDVTVELEATTWTLEPGHRLRLAIAGSDWPNCWPPPTPVRLGVDWASVELTLPRVGGGAGVDARLPPGDGPRPVDDDVVWRIEHDVLGRETRAITRYGGRYDGAARRGGRRPSTTGTVGVSTVDPAGRSPSATRPTRSPGRRRRAAAR